jgi:hypothetical protein
MTNTNVTASYQTVEYNKFVELDHSVFPPISVIRVQYPDQSQAFPQNYNVQPVSSVDVYPKYGVLTHITNPDDISISLSAGQVNVELEDIEALLTANNAFTLLQSFQLSGITAYVDDLEKNTFDTASACDDIYWQTVRLNSQTEILTANSYFGTSNNNPLFVTSTQAYPNVVSYADTPNLDAFGRLRVSQPITLFDSKTIYNKERYFWNSRQKDATEIFLTNDSSRFAIITAANGYYVKETYRCFQYQPGKSQLCLVTGVLSAETDIVKRVGLFTALSSNNYSDKTIGIYFQAASAAGLTNRQSYAWVINNDSNHTPPQSATQDLWNLDKMDGTGPSGITIDFTKSQIFVFDYEWLGVGRVRCGFNINGITYYCHQFLHANNITGTYMTQPNLPLRAEIRSVGASSGSMKTICASIMSEGGADAPTFVTRSVSTSAIANVGTNNRRGILGVRLNPERPNGTNDIIDISTVCDTGNAATTGPYRVELVFRPLPAQGVTWVSTNNGSNMQYAVATSGVIITGGNTAVAEFAANNSSVNLSKPQYDKTLKLGRDLDGVPDELWLVVTPLVAINGIYGAITFAEAD